MRAEQQARERRRRFAWLGGGAAVVAVLVVVIVVVSLSSSSGGGSSQVIPPGVAGGTPVVQPTALTVTNTSGINGVVAYDTAGYPASSSNGPAAQALGRTHVPGPVTYSVTPPVGGAHNAAWMNCGIYTQAVPNERAVHNLEHGAVWITYQPSLPQSEVNTLRAFVERQTVISPAGSAGSRYLDLTPYSGLPSPIVVSSWGFQLRLSSPSDPRLQEFVNKFRASQTYSPEYGAACTGGVGTPLEK
jgi:hypothetical protein